MFLKHKQKNHQAVLNFLTKPPHMPVLTNKKLKFTIGNWELISNLDTNQNLGK